jgi:5-methylthioadenosine/S-adenosylhomocysteine deaminase
MSRDKPVDLVVENGQVLTVDDRFSIIADGYVAVRDRRIVQVGDGRREKAPEAGTRINARGGVIMPGLVNCHTHAAMTCLRGLADDLPLMAWLNDYIFPAEARLDGEKIFQGALLACAEMLLSGTTCFCDMYLFEDAVARAAAAAGMRAVVGEVLYDFPSPNYGTIDRGLQYTEDLIERWRDHALVSVAVEPHSTYLCAPDLLRETFALARQHQVPWVIHLSETRSEVDQVMAKYGRTPVGLLADLDVLARRVVACHCVVLSDEDIDLLKERDVKVAHNPESNMKLASGIAPVPRMLAAGICVGLGTDGCASNNDLDMFAEMGSAARLHKVASLDPTVLDARTAIRMATIDAARVLGLDAHIGSLETGKQADIIVIDTARPHLTPMYHPESHMVYAARGSDVVATIIDGRVVMQDGRITTIDVHAAMEAVGKIAQELR